MALLRIVTTCMIIAAICCAGRSRKLAPFCYRSGLLCDNEIIARKCGSYSFCKLIWMAKDKDSKLKMNLPKSTKWNKAKQLNLSPNSLLDRVDVPKPITSGNAKTITVGLYFESLCPACREFIVYQMYPAFKKLFSSGILQVDLVPFGNGEAIPSGTSFIFNCQHGPPECIGNKIETCAIDVLRDPTKFMPFIHCLEFYGPTLDNAYYCSYHLQIDYAPLASCISSENGNRLLRQMALRTASLRPPHTYVPWITVNGVHTDEIQKAVQSNMLQYVCNAYKGPKPAACNSTLEVCHKEF